MKIFRKNDSSETEFIPGFHGRFVHTGDKTLAYIRIEKGSILQKHSHINAQTTQIISGHLQITIGSDTLDLKAGDVLEIPSNVPHSGIAIDDCLVHDIFIPERADYKF